MAAVAAVGASTSASVLLGASEPASVADILHKKAATIEMLQGSSAASQAARVQVYAHERSPLAVYPTVVGTIAKYTALGGLGGMGVGAAIGLGHPATIGAGGATGAVLGFGYGCVVAYDEQQSLYADWIKNATNAKVNADVIKFIKALAMQEVNANPSDPRYEMLLDPVKETLMTRPVVDPTCGKVIDYNLHHVWIDLHGRSLFNHHQKLTSKDLRVSYETVGRLTVLYKQLLAAEVGGVRLNAEQRKCIQILLKDLDKDCKMYYNRARELADKDYKAGKLTIKQHAAKMMDLANILEPT